MSQEVKIKTEATPLRDVKRPEETNTKARFRLSFRLSPESRLSAPLYLGAPTQRTAVMTNISILGRQVRDKSDLTVNQLKSLNGNERLILTRHRGRRGSDSGGEQSGDVTLTQ